MKPEVGRDADNRFLSSGAQRIGVAYNESERYSRGFVLIISTRNKYTAVYKRVSSWIVILD
jgi:hypothetical protein